MKLKMRKVGLLTGNIIYRAKLHEPRWQRGEVYILYFFKKVVKKNLRLGFLNKYRTTYIKQIPIYSNNKKISFLCKLFFRNDFIFL